MATQEQPRTHRGNNETTEKGTVTIARAAAEGEDPGGRIQIGDEVVATIAGLAARQVPGLFSLGKPRLVSFGNGQRRGVTAEVGKAEAALDLDVVINYDCDLRETAGQLRRLIGDEVDRMAGRKVVEVNINVVDVQLPDQGQEAKPDQRRVR